MDGVTGFDILIILLIILMFSAAARMQQGREARLILGFVLGGVIICLFIAVFILSHQ